MKSKAIIPCPEKFWRAGIHTMAEAVALVHIGRCGLHGCQLASMAEAMRMPMTTADSVTRRLKTRGWITRFSRKSTQGRAFLWVVTVKGWDLLTSEQDVSLFPDALKMEVRK